MTGTTAPSGSSLCPTCGAQFSWTGSARRRFCALPCMASASRTLADALAEVERGLANESMTAEQAVERIRATPIWSNAYEPADSGSKEARATARGVQRSVRDLQARASVRATSLTAATPVPSPSGGAS